MSPEGDIADLNVELGYRRVGTVNFAAAVRADSCFFLPTSEEDPRHETACSDSRRAPEAWCSWTGTMQAHIPTRLLTLLSNTPQTKECSSGSPHPIIHRGPLRVCRGWRAVLLRGAVHDGRKDQAFPKPLSSEAHHVVA